MAVVVTDINGEEHVYDGEGEEVSFETEEVCNNLVVESPTKFTCFAAGRWHKVEMDKDAQPS